MSEEVNLDLTYTETMQLISAFKKHTILWNPHIIRYNKKKRKDESWKLVAAETGFHPEVCKRKIKSLLTTCRRVKISIIKSRGSEAPVEPKWRYWNAFKFLRGVDDDEDDPLGTAPEMDLMDPTVTPAWLKSRLVGKRKIKPAKPSPEQESLARPQKYSTPQKESDEYHSIGVTVAAKLRKMYHDQRLYAENLINQALYRGILSQLTKQSEIKTPIAKGQLKIQPITDPPVLSTSKLKTPPGKSQANVKMSTQ